MLLGGRGLENFSGTPSAILDHILRILSDAPGPLTVREIVERSGQSNLIVDKGLRLLLSIGLVEYSEGKYLLNSALKEAMSPS